MGIFSKLFRPKSSQKAPNRDELLRLLFNSIGSRNQTRFETLCKKHPDLIRESFPEWKVVPPVYRKVDDGQQYVNMLIEVASYFQKSGDTSLMELLDFHEAVQMCYRWEKPLENAVQLTEDKGHEEYINTNRFFRQFF